MKINVFTGILPIVVILLNINVISFAKDKEAPYLRNGISFSISENWRIIANDSVGDNAYYFSAERTGKKATGLITVNWINKVESTEKTIMLHQQSMKTANIFRNPGIEFSSTIQENFAGFRCESCRYTTIVKEQKLDGFIYCLNFSQKTVTIIFQTGLNDQKINIKAFNLFRQTFNCRE